MLQVEVFQAVVAAVFVDSGGSSLEAARNVCAITGVIGGPEAAAEAEAELAPAAAPQGEEVPRVSNGSAQGTPADVIRCAQDLATASPFGNEKYQSWCQRFYRINCTFVEVVLPVLSYVR